MHLVFLLNVVRRWQIATAAGDERRSAAFGATLEQIARDGTVFASAVSEPRQDLTRPATTATRDRDRLDRLRPQDLLHDVAGGATCSTPPSPTPTTRRRERYGYAMVPRDTTGRRRPRRLGRARHACLGQPLGLVRGRASFRRRRSAEASPRVTPPGTGKEPQRGAVPRGSRTRDRRERARERRLAARRRARARSAHADARRRRTSSTSPRAAQSSRAPRR